MDKDKAISNISDVLQKNDSDLYVFQPKDIEEKFFIETAAVAAAAGILLTAFLKGVMSTLEERAEGVGKRLGNWMVDRLEGLFRSKTNTPDEEEVHNAAAAAKTAVSKSNANDISTAISETEQLLISALHDKGILKSRAAEIVSEVRSSAVSLIEGS